MIAPSHRRLGPIDPEEESPLRRHIHYRLEARHLPARVRTGGGTNPSESSEAPGPDENGLAVESVHGTSEILPLRDMELLYLHHVLERVDENKRRTAALLGIGRRTLYRKLDRETPAPDR